MTNNNTKLIAEIRKLMAEASGGTWRAGISHPPRGTEGPSHAIVSNGEFVICEIPGNPGDEGVRDAKLIAALRNAAPRLLDAADRYERLRATLDKKENQK